MFQFPSLAPFAYIFSERYVGMTPRGFPHSEILGSKLACSSPRLNAACHVLLRLLAPRHSPYALSSLTTENFFRSIRILDTRGQCYPQEPSLSINQTRSLLRQYHLFYFQKTRWRISDSNRRPPPCKGGALPAELLPRYRGDSGGPRWT